MHGYSITSLGSYWVTQFLYSNYPNRQIFCQKATWCILWVFFTWSQYRRREKNIYTWLPFLVKFNGITSYGIVNLLNCFDLELFTDSADYANLGYLICVWYSLGLFSSTISVEGVCYFLRYNILKLIPIHITMRCGAVVCQVNGSLFILTM